MTWRYLLTYSLSSLIDTIRYRGLIIAAIHGQLYLSSVRMKQIKMSAIEIKLSTLSTIQDCKELSSWSRYQLRAYWKTSRINRQDISMATVIHCGSLGSCMLVQRLFESLHYHSLKSWYQESPFSFLRMMSRHHYGLSNWVRVTYPKMMKYFRGISLLCHSLYFLALSDSLSRSLR